VTSLITALTAIAAVVFTGLSLRATEEGQVTDRYTKAVGQLDQAGAEHLQARLGGIYALERLAIDSPRDQPTIVEILSAFIRTSRATRSATTSVVCPLQTLGPDIQAALTVLGRRDRSHDAETVVDFSHTCFAGAEMKYQNLQHVHLEAAGFNGAILVGADLNGAKLFAADLTADLTFANLSDADLHGAKLSGAVLIDAVLRGTTLSFADLRGADLRGADLRGADLRDAMHDDRTLIAGVATDSHTRGVWW
jgi:hypothetical protein